MPRLQARSFRTEVQGANLCSTCGSAPLLEITTAPPPSASVRSRQIICPKCGAASVRLRNHWEVLLNWNYTHRKPATVFSRLAFAFRQWRIKRRAAKIRRVMAGLNG